MPCTSVFSVVYFFQATLFHAEGILITMCSGLLKMGMTVMLMASRSVNGPHFEARTRPEPEITSPNLARTRHIFLKPDLGPNTKFTDGVKICATAVYQKRSVRV